jgi:uncharacterized membrane protein YeiH
MLTGIGGGMVRSVLVREIPTVLRTSLYAVGALIGAAGCPCRKMRRNRGGSNHLIAARSWPSSKSAGYPTGTNVRLPE